MPDPKPKQEHPLANILINVLIPVMALDHLSKDPERLGSAAKFWHIGPLWAMTVALALPLGYGLWHFAKTRKVNFFSGVGLVSILLTGGLTFYLWNADGTVKPNAGLLVGLKEAMIPLMLGIAVLGSLRFGTPLLRVFLYNDTLFDVPKIEAKIAERSEESGYKRLIDSATKLFAASFFISAPLNIGLALWLFRNFDASAADATEKYNKIISTMTWSGLLVIGLPLLGIIFVLFTRLIKGLRDLTGLEEKDVLLPR
ncbi:VC0807 family protein [Luteolibacter marinus]|uniref:VC0807 family protein n=1 Tax=Luteolibacter marinus TaxID=2776705 RepID=UPI001868314A|nr:VC0807 family protein [Luteolibacter marinus]